MTPDPQVERVPAPPGRASGMIARGLGGPDEIRWPLARSSDLFDLKYGKALVASSRRHGTIPVYGTNGVTGSHDTALFKGPGVVLGRKGVGNLGVEWVDDDYWVIDTAYSLSVADNVDLKFAFYLIKHVGLNHLKDGTSNPSLTRNTFGAQFFPAPPLREQRRIASVLGAFDDLVETNRAIAENAADLARAVPAALEVTTPLADIAAVSKPKQVRPEGQVEHYSLPSFDDGQVPEAVDGESIKSNKIPFTAPTVLVSRLNPKWERCWMAYPGVRSLASTEFVPLVGKDVSAEEVWAVASAPPFWEQMRSRVTGTTGSHQRVDKAAIPTLRVPDVRVLAPEQRERVVSLVRMIQACRDEIADLTRTRDELLPLLMSGRIRVDDVEGVA